MSYKRGREFGQRACSFIDFGYLIHNPGIGFKTFLNCTNTVARLVILAHVSRSHPNRPTTLQVQFANISKFKDHMSVSCLNIFFATICHSFELIILCVHRDHIISYVNINSRDHSCLCRCYSVSRLITIAFSGTTWSLLSHRPEVVHSRPHITPVVAFISSQIAKRLADLGISLPYLSIYASKQ